MTFEVGAGEDHLHVPLLLSPFGYTIYRGSCGHAIASQTLHARIAELAQINSAHEGGGLITARSTRPSTTRGRVRVRADARCRAGGAARRCRQPVRAWRRRRARLPAAADRLALRHDAQRRPLRRRARRARRDRRDPRAAGPRVQPRRTIEVVGFAGEEPRFGAGCIGSRAMVGARSRADLDRMRDRDGISIAEAMLERGLDPDRLDEALIDPATVHALVELHIEQGSVLETERDPDRRGRAHRRAARSPRHLAGLGRHAGSTPMALRRDALTAAAEVVLAVERLARRRPAARRSAPSACSLAAARQRDPRPGRDRHRHPRLTTLRRASRSSRRCSRSCGASRAARAGGHGRDDHARRPGGLRSAIVRGRARRVRGARGRRRSGWSAAPTTTRWCSARRCRSG